MTDSVDGAALKLFLVPQIEALDRRHPQITNA